MTPRHPPNKDTVALRSETRGIRTIKTARKSSILAVSTGACTGTPIKTGGAATTSRVSGPSATTKYRSGRSHPISVRARYRSRHTTSNHGSRRRSGTGTSSADATTEKNSDHAHTLSIGTTGSAALRVFDRGNTGLRRNYTCRTSTRAVGVFRCAGTSRRNAAV